MKKVGAFLSLKSCHPLGWQNCRDERKPSPRADRSLPHPRMTRAFFFSCSCSWDAVTEKGPSKQSQAHGPHVSRALRETTGSPGMEEIPATRTGGGEDKVWGHPPKTT